MRKFYSLAAVSTHQEEDDIEIHHGQLFVITVNAPVISTMADTPPVSSAAAVLSTYTPAVPAVTVTTGLPSATLVVPSSAAQMADGAQPPIVPSRTAEPDSSLVQRLPCNRKVAPAIVVRMSREPTFTCHTHPAFGSTGAGAGSAVPYRTESFSGTARALVAACTVTSGLGNLSHLVQDHCRLLGLSLQSPPVHGLPQLNRSDIRPVAVKMDLTRQLVMQQVTAVSTTQATVMLFIEPMRRSLGAHTPTQSDLQLHRVYYSSLHETPMPREYTVSTNVFRTIQRCASLFSDIANFMSLFSSAMNILLTIDPWTDVQLGHLQDLSAAFCIISRDMSCLSTIAVLDLQGSDRERP